MCSLSSIRNAWTESNDTIDTGAFDASVRAYELPDHPPVCFPKMVRDDQKWAVTNKKDYKKTFPHNVVACITEEQFLDLKKLQTKYNVSLTTILRDAVDYYLGRKAEDLQ